MTPKTIENLGLRAVVRHHLGNFFDLNNFNKKVDSGEIYAHIEYLENMDKEAANAYAFYTEERPVGDEYRKVLSDIYDSIEIDPP